MFQLRKCYANFEVVYTFKLITQASVNCYGAENCNLSEVITFFKVSTSDYLPLNSIFSKTLKYSTYITRLEKLQNNTKLTASDILSEKHPRGKFATPAVLLDSTDTLHLIQSFLTVNQ